MGGLFLGVSLYENKTQAWCSEYVNATLIFMGSGDLLPGNFVAAQQQ